MGLKLDFTLAIQTVMYQLIICVKNSYLNKLCGVVVSHAND